MGGFLQPWYPFWWFFGRNSIRKKLKFWLSVSFGFCSTVTQKKKHIRSIPALPGFDEIRYEWADEVRLGRGGFMFFVVKMWTCFPAIRESGEMVVPFSPSMCFRCFVSKWNLLRWVGSRLKLAFCWPLPFWLVFWLKRMIWSKVGKFNWDYKVCVRLFRQLAFGVWFRSFVCSAKKSNRWKMCFKCFLHTELRERWVKILWSFILQPTFIQP